MSKSGKKALQRAHREFMRRYPGVFTYKLRDAAGEIIHRLYRPYEIKNYVSWE